VSAIGQQYLRTKFVDTFCIVLKSGDLIAKAVKSIHVSTVIQQFQVLLLQHMKPHLLQQQQATNYLLLMQSAANRHLQEQTKKISV